MPMSVSRHISLGELQSLIRQGIDKAHPLPYWVAAEISELKVNYSGHCYLELVEKGGENHVPRAKASAVIWRSSYAMISSYFSSATGGQALGAGLKVLVKVVVSYHELYGLSLQITDIDPAYTLGDMEQQRQATIARLQQDGVYDMNRELPLPGVIQRIAVISSRNAAGYQDFMKELTASAYRFDVTLFDAFMQGAGSEDSIVHALEEAAGQADRFDALVLIRGGGSQSDLGSFNSYRLCCYLAQFPLPLLTGIGHDKDQSVADLVAAVALKTPTAVAVYLKKGMEAFDARLDALYDELTAWVSGTIDAQRNALKNAAFALSREAMQRIHDSRLRLGQTGGRLQYAAGMSLRRGTDRLSGWRDRLGQGARFALSNGDMRLDNLRQMLVHRSREYAASRGKELSLLGDLVRSNDPQRIMERGFAVVRSGGRVITDAAQLDEGGRIEIEIRKHIVEAEIKRIR